MEFSGKDEQQLGAREVFGTLNEISVYAERIPYLLKWLEQF
jgi:hypothetical protein